MPLELNYVYKMFIKEVALQNHTLFLHQPNSLSDFVFTRPQVIIIQISFIITIVYELTPIMDLIIRPIKLDKIGQLAPNLQQRNILNIKTNINKKLKQNINKKYKKHFLSN